MRNLEEYNQAYSGHPALILASGPSLLDHLDFLRFREFLSSPPGRWVTFAVNSAYAAHETDFFLSDDWETSLWSYFAIDLRNSRKTQVLLYEDKLGDKADWFGDRSILFRHRPRYHITDKYEHEVKKNHIVQCRSSVGSCIHVAHIMGCSPIILFGLDCCRDGPYRWFWQHPGFTNKPKRLDGRKADKYRWRKGMDSDYDLMDILSYWEKRGKEITKKCKVYNCSRLSKVTVFPKIEEKNFHEI